MWLLSTMVLEGTRQGSVLGMTMLNRKLRVQTSKGASGVHSRPQMLGDCSENHSLSTDSKSVLRQTWKNVIYGQNGFQENCHERKGGQSQERSQVKGES